MHRHLTQPKVHKKAYKYLIYALCLGEIFSHTKTKNTSEEGILSGPYIPIYGLWIIK